MAKCNLLKPNINDNGGTFYTFSQWADDMTLQNALGDAYRIVPSRFACFNIPSGSTYNAGKTLQDLFEHKCAALRHYMDIDTHLEKFTPKNASILFWEALKDGFGISDPWSQMVFVGEMDLQGTNYIDGVSYSEMYCIVPANAKKMTSWHQASDHTGDVITFNEPSYGVPFGWTSALPDGAESNATYPVSTPSFFSGPAIFTTEDNQTVYSSLNTLDSLHQVYMQNILNNGNYFQLDTSAKQFKFNAIALFYDIVAKNEQNNYHYIYTAVPMGMYFTQKDTTITKFVTNDDIYGQGTSYGLRVTTKFCAESLLEQGGQTLAGSSISASIDDLYPEMSAVMDRFNAAAETLSDYTDKVQSSIEQMTNHISNFKDNKVNVPYIREIKSPGDAAPEKYWFVNGRSTGVKVSDSYTIYYDDATGSGIGDLTTLITNVLNDAITNNTTNLGDYIDQSVAEYITNNNPASTLQTKPYIEYIKAQKYTGNASITKIPNLEDYQMLINTDPNANPTGMFSGCENLVAIPRLELHNATDLSSFCMNCKKLVSLYLADTISCTNFDNAFNGCEKLENLVIDATSATSFSNTFKDCKKLKNLRIYNIDPKLVNVIDLSDCTDLDFASLESIVMSMKSQIYDEVFDTNGPTQQVILNLPSSLNESNRSIMDLVYNAQMNKNIRIIITN